MDIFEMLTTILTKIKTIIKDANEMALNIFLFIIIAYLINIESRG